MKGNTQDITLLERIGARRQAMHLTELLARVWRGVNPSTSRYGGALDLGRGPGSSRAGLHPDFKQAVDRN
ncbi:hypothetical protein AWB69_04907 [Caballeronia udeis]|uniref:Uncharacterized protein n=1 Tax=Caballeronia udeis TaxID=1232866 RepID=A0A158HY89_9BURK|nr:hypothetical protein AWB69_04907 [Caballeronia udeis]